ncbi:unnamed protein product [Boreogadus saida]
MFTCGRPLDIREQRSIVAVQEGTFNVLPNEVLDDMNNANPRRWSGAGSLGAEPFSPEHRVGAVVWCWEPRCRTLQPRAQGRGGGLVLGASVQNPSAQSTGSGRWSGAGSLGAEPFSPEHRKTLNSRANPVSYKGKRFVHRVLHCS